MKANYSKFLIFVFAVFIMGISFAQEQKKESFDLFLSKQKDKIVYLDFWASWCAPCIKEIPNIFKLKNQYDESKIIFVFISIDKDIRKWKEISETLGIASYKYNFNFYEFEEFEIFKNLKINSLPRYIVLKDSMILDKNAPKPSKKAIHNYLDY